MITVHQNKFNIFLLLLVCQRANGQVERLNSTVIAVISILSKDDPTKWFKFAPELQRILNSTYQRSINLTPFELLVGVKLRDKTDLKIRELIEEEIRSNFQESRENLRKGAKQQILKVQESNRKTYNLRRKPPNKYKINDIVAMKRTQHGPDLKFKSKFLGPYKITKIKPNDTYDVKKIGFVEGPIFSRCMLVLGPEPGQEGRLWATSRSRVPVDGTGIGSDVRGPKRRRTVRDDEAVEDA
ncbi:hypothetical protein AVEN_232927-1 [Araneus ventricosus]|uniref:Integrase catalytic domain-containing protein n=1 Tax=Araneus ventricosus TaxID=182803 RepID=A0A4Y2X1D5_ARAVE|nr:hypothetical protein AVEN_232927-1 [Araneus ventricosus]